MDTVVVLACVAALVAASGWGLGTILFERFFHTHADAPSAAACNLYKNLVAGALFVVVALVLGSAPVPREAWGVLLLSGFLGFAVGDTCTFAALPLCGVQLTALLSNLIPPLAALLGWVFLDEELSPLTLGSMVVVLVGVTLVVRDTGGRRGREGRVGAGVAFAVLAALSQAVAIVIGRFGLRGIDVFPGTVARIAGGVGGALVMALAAGLLPRGRRAGGPRAELVALARPWRSRALALGLLPATFFAAILILPLHSAAVRGAPSGVSAALLATTPLFTLPLGLLFGMHPSRQTVVGTLIGFLGAVGTILGTS